MAKGLRPFASHPQFNIFNPKGNSVLIWKHPLPSSSGLTRGESGTGVSAQTTNPLGRPVRARGLLRTAGAADRLSTHRERRAERGRAPASREVHLPLHGGRMLRRTYVHTGFKPALPCTPSERQPSARTRCIHPSSAVP